MTDVPVPCQSIAAKIAELNDRLSEGMGEPPTPIDPQHGGKPTPGTKGSLSDAEIQALRDQISAQYDLLEKCVDRYAPLPLTLAQAMKRVEPAGFVKTARQLAPLVGLPAPVSVRRLLRTVAQFRRIAHAPLTFFQQNMGLFPGAFYKGISAKVSTDTLIERLREQRPDIVGLSEIYTDAVYERLQNDLGDIYPYSARGPDEEDEDWTGDCVLLSKYPFVDEGWADQTIFRQCLGEDCLVNKGVLHKRIEVPGHPCRYDVCITHMQSCPTEQGWIVLLGITDVDDPDNLFSGKIFDCQHILKEQQMDHLASFCHSNRQPSTITVLMGDLNQDGLSSEYAHLVQKLAPPSTNQLAPPVQDAWKVALAHGSERIPPPPPFAPKDVGDKGITYDRANIFTREDFIKSPLDAPIFTQIEGRRLDYFFVWPGVYRPLYSRSDVIEWGYRAAEFPGKTLHISDHFGLRVEQLTVAELEADESQPIKSILLSLAGFHCLTETNGAGTFLSRVLEADEIQFAFAFTAANGQTGTRKVPEYAEYINSGDTGTISDASLWLGDPGEWLAIRVQAWEVDFVGTKDLETGRVLLGPTDKVLSRRELLLMKGRSHELTFLINGDEGEYAVACRVLVI